MGLEGEGSGGKGGGKWGERWREVGIGYPPVHPLFQSKGLIIRLFLSEAILLLVCIVVHGIFVQDGRKAATLGLSRYIENTR